MDHDVRLAILATIALALVVTSPTPGLAAVIVAPAGPAPSVVSSEKKPDRDAAADLCNYLGRVTGRPIVPATQPAATGAVIHVGIDPFVRGHAPEIDRLFADGYVVKCVIDAGRPHIILAGRQGPSATWAVEQFLENFCGVRFLFPDPRFGEVVPSRPTISIADDYSRAYIPDYVSRYNCSMTYLTPNQMFLRGRPKFYDYGSHAIQFIFSEPEFKAHPEWFAFFKGKRQWWSYGNGWQICTTNSGTVRHAVKYALDYLAKNPDVPVVSIGHNDGAGWCECPECTKFINSFNPPYTTSERWFAWVNQVAREVGKVYPDKWVESMAYASTSAPPRFALEPNVAITKTIVLPEELAQAEQWGKVCRSVNLYSYMYGSSFLGFRHYPHAAQDFLKWGHDKLGALSHVTECDGDWTFDGPKYHYINALQWDVNTDVDKLMADFCRDSYGAAAGPMIAFWDRLEKVYDRCDPRERQAFYVWVGWQQAYNVKPNYELRDYTAEDVAALDQSMSEATKLAAKDSDAVQFRVARMEEAWRYFRTAVVSRIEFTDQLLPQRLTTDEQVKQATEQAGRIAALRAERAEMLGRMRLYPHINRRMVQPAYWSYFTGMTLFNRELTLEDALLSAAAGRDAGAAAGANLFTNGGFEAGNASGWEAEGGELTVIRQGARTGRAAARTSGAGEVSLLRKLPVRYGQRYRLTGWCRSEGEMPEIPAPVDSIIEFYGNAGQRIWHTEPVRNVPYAPDGKGWLRVQSVFDIPPGAELATIKLRKLYDGGAMLWDDVAMYRIREAPADEGGLRDAFPGERLDEQRWFQIVSSGGLLPRLADGWLILEPGRCPIASAATFPSLLNPAGPGKRSLRFRVKVRESAGPVSLRWAIQTGTGAISTEGTGMLWAQEIGAGGSLGRLLGYSHQGGKTLHSDVQDLAGRADLSGHVEWWYTILFDVTTATVYMSPSGFSQSEAARVSQLPHGITDWQANGRPRFKLEGSGCAIGDLEIVGGGRARQDSTNPITTAPADKHDLAIPGVGN